MDDVEYFKEYLSRFPVIGIFRNATAEHTVKLCRKAWDAGVELVEIPAQDEAGMQALRAALAESAGREVGAGTITSVKRLEDVVAAGARFTVAPGLNLEVVARSRELGVPHLPGVATATEIGSAMRAGITWVKAFPAAQLGPGWVQSQRGPFPDIQFVATGGVSPENVMDFLDAGCGGVAVGSGFEAPEAISRLTAAVHDWRAL